MAATSDGAERANTSFAKDQLKAIVERIERLEEEKKTIADDIRDIYAESKCFGFDVKALRAVVRLRKEDAAKRREHEAILETYMHALGMLADLPLGQAAIERAAASPGVRSAIKKMGEPVPLTEEEKARGDAAAFVDKHGNRVSIGMAAAKT